MIFLTSLAKIQHYQLFANTGLMTGQLSNDSVLDTVKCSSAVYQLLQNQSVMAKGTKSGLLTNVVQFEFFYTGLDNIVQLICFNAQIWFLTAAGNILRENTVVSGKLTYVADLSVLNVKQITAFNTLMIILAGDGLYAKGPCASKFCIQDGLFAAFTKITLPPAIALTDILNVQLDQNASYLYIYMQNGDVYATGDNTNKVLPAAAYPDTDAVRLIGTGIKNVKQGWNTSRAEKTLFYMKGTTLYAHNGNSVPPERVVMENIIDYTVYVWQLFYLKEQSLHVQLEDASLQSGLALFCTLNPNDQLCLKQLAGTCYVQSDCYTAGVLNIDIDFCKVQYCVLNSCPKADCDPTNTTCIAIQCIDMLTYLYNPLCYNNHVQTTYSTKLVNAKDYVFKNGMLMQTAYSPAPVDPPTPVTPEKQKSQMKAGAAAGITVAICIVVFVVAFAAVMVVMKKRLNKRNSSGINLSTSINTSENEAK
ncbi:Hypothetical_protein [Hexamita inflata]|uniref:Hypothetical_protein n=1 Tax=Hexamita inflata TaxID=28002 RepID=A0AA86TVV6_9EUKA|nr:Hypothetical protein HINF_LOCUS11148 [Hexamita inflata]